MLLLLLLAAADYPALPPDLARAAIAFDAAQADGDAAALERLVADDYTLIDSRGAVENKRQFIADTSGPAHALGPFRIEQPVQRVWGTTAALAGVVHLTVRRPDGTEQRIGLRFTDVWVRRSGAWRVVFTHANRVD